MNKNNRKLFVIASQNTHAAINVAAFNDKELSYKAKGIHAFIRTRAPGEIVQMPDLIEGSSDGRDAVHSGVKELILRKYLHLIQLRDEQGRLSSAVYVSLPTPTTIDPDVLRQIINDGQGFLPYPDFPYTENPEAKQEDVLSRTDYNSTNSLSSRENYLNNYYYYINSPIGLLNNNNNYSTSASGRLSNIDKLFTIWNELTNTPTHRRGSQYKTYRTITNHLDKALRKHSAMVIKQAMEVYDWFINQPYTVVARYTGSPAIVGLNEFFKFGTYGQKAIEKMVDPLNKIESWFVEAKRGKEYLMNTYGLTTKDPHPIITSTLRDIIYEHRTTFGMNDLKKDGGSYTYTPHQTNTLHTVSHLLHEFREKHKDRLPARFTVYQHVEKLIKFVTKSNPKIHLGWLISDITWAEMKHYLIEAGIMEQTTKAQPRGNRNGISKASC